MNFSTRRLVVEPLTVSHAEALSGLMDARVNAHFASEDVPMSLAELRQQFGEAEAAAREGHGDAQFIPLVVKTEHDGRYIGRLEALVHGRDAEIAFVFIPESWGYGYATEATVALIGQLSGAGVARVWACVTPTNKPSLALCKRLDFSKCEARPDLDLATYDDGDTVLMLSLANEGQLSAR